jgi:outer membrane biosynthesis protein TonB
MSNRNSASRRRASSGAGGSVEFADLLDPIVGTVLTIIEPDPVPDLIPIPQPDPDPIPEPQPIPQPDPIPEPHPEPNPIPQPDPIPQPEPEPEPEPEPILIPAVSRFADAGLDDDRLPVLTKRRWLHR